MGQSGRDHDLAELARDRAEHEAPHRAPLATAIVMEPLIELILVIAGVIVTAALLPLHTRSGLRKEGRNGSPLLRRSLFS